MDEGFEVHSTNHGKKALDLFAQHQHQIVFIDIFLPDINGFDVLTEIKTKNELSEIILFSGFGDMDMVIKAMRSGASDFLNKPFTGNELLKSLKNAQSRYFEKTKAIVLHNQTQEGTYFVEQPQLSSLISIQAFGSLTLYVGDKTIKASDWPGHKSNSVIRLFLINHNSPILIDTFVDKLWPEAQRRSAEVMFYSAISTIRYFLEPDLKNARHSKYLKTIEKGYMLDLGQLGVNYSYDVEEF